MKLTALLLLATLGQTEMTNPCMNPAPTTACENALAEQALYWEQKYLSERLQHLKLVEACSELATPSEPPAEEESALWVIVGAIAGALLLGGGVTYAASRI